MCRSAQCGETAPNIYRPATWRRTTDCAGSWIIMKNDTSTPRWWHRYLDTHAHTHERKERKKEKNYRKHLLSLLSWLDSPQTIIHYYSAGAESQHAETSLLPLFPERSSVTSSPRSRPSLWKGKENSHRPTAAAARKSCASGWRGEEKKKERVGRQAAARKARCKESDSEEDQRTSWSDSLLK